MREGARVWIERLRAAPYEAVLAQTRQRQPAWSEPERAAFVDSQREFSPSIYGTDALGYFWDWRPLVAAIRTPTLVIVGDRSAPAFPPSSADAELVAEMRQVMPGTRIVQIAGAGHFVHLDQPTEFVAAVEAFLT